MSFDAPISAGQLSELIQAVVTGNADAESDLSELIDSHPQALLSLLFSVLSESPNSVFSRLCLIRMSHVFSSGGYDQVDPTFDESCQSSLFAVLQSDVLCMETYSTVSSLLARAAHSFSRHRPWRDFASALTAFCFSPNNALAAAALDCLLQCAQLGFGDVPDAMDEIYECAFSGPEFCVQRVLAVYRLLFSGPDFGCLEHSLSALPDVIARSEAPWTNYLLSALSDFIPAHFELLAPPLFDMLLAILRDTGQPKGTRELCLETIVSVCEENPDDMAASLVTVYETLIALICELDPNDDLESDTYEDETPRTSAELCIERLCNCFRDPMFECASDSVAELLSSGDAATHRCGFVVLSCTASHFAGDLEELFNGLLAGLSDTVVIVQRAAFDALACVSRKFDGAFQLGYHAAVMPLFLEHIAGGGSRAGLRAVAEFCDKMPEPDLALYARDVLEALTRLFGESPFHLEVLECVKAILKISCYESEFYEQIVPFLFDVVRSCPVTLGLPAIEAFSFLGFYCPPDAFLTDAEFAVSVLNEIDIADLGTQEFASYNEAIKCLVLWIGKHYTEMLVPLLRRVLEFANIGIEGQIMSGPIDKSETAQYVVAGDRLFEKWRLDELEKALETISTFCYLTKLLPDHVVMVLTVLVKSLGYWFYEAIQTRATECLNWVLVGMVDLGVTDCSCFVPVIRAFVGVSVNSVKDFVEFCSRVCEVCRRGSTFGPELLAAMVDVVREIAKKPECLVAAAELLGDLFRTTQESSFFDEGFQAMFGEQDVCARMIAWSSLVSWSHADSGLFASILGLVLQCLGDEDAEVRTVAVKTLVRLVEAEQMDEDQVRAAAAGVTETLDADECREAMNWGVLALTLLFDKCRDLLNEAEVVKRWLEAMPLTGNARAEFQGVYELFAALLCETPLVVQACPLGKIARIVGKAVRGSRASDEAKGRMKQFLMAVSEQGPDEFQEALAYLDRKSQRHINELLTEADA